MLKYFDYIVVISMFIGISIAVDYLGWPTMEQNKAWGSALPVSYVLLIFLVLRIDKFLKSKGFNFIFFLITFLLISVYRYVIGDGTGLFKILSVLITPLMAMFWAFDMKERGNSGSVKKLFLLLFFISLLIAIYEKFAHTLLFPYSNFNHYDLNGTIHGEYVRSNSVWGHPLTNAFTVSVIMIFIYWSDLRSVYKWTLYMGGFVSLLCFGGRGAFFISILFGFLSLLLPTGKKIKIADIVKRVIFFVFSVLILYYLVSYTTLSDRLLGLKTDSSDYSTNERIEAFQYLMNIDSSALFRGIGQNDYLLTHNHIENWILMFVMTFGVIITAYIVFYYIYICLYSLNGYSKFKKICLFGVFISISLTNNSLAIASPAFPIYFLCCAIFFNANTNPNNSQRYHVISRKLK